jgi:hypothetical protein
LKNAIEEFKNTINDEKKLDDFIINLEKSLN